MASGGGEGTKSGGRSLVKEGTHRTRLLEESLHCQDCKNGDMMNRYTIQVNSILIESRVKHGEEDDSITF